MRSVEIPIEVRDGEVYAVNPDGSETHVGNVDRILQRAAARSVREPTFSEDNFRQNWQHSGV